MQRIGVVLAAVAILLSGCSSNDKPDSAVTSSSTSVQPADAENRTTDATKSDAVTTTNRPSASAGPSPTSSAEEAHLPPEETTEEAKPSPEPPVEPEPDPCVPDSLSNDLLGYAGGVGVIACEQGWAYAFHVGGTGDTEFVAQRQNGQWVRIAGLGSPTCQEELVEQGAPRSVVVDFRPCDLMYPPEGPTEPVEDCVVPTEQFGATHAYPLHNITCDQAAEQFYSAADNYPPSFDEPIITPAGWECWVYPHDPSYAVAGSCTSPDGSAHFVLNVPSYR